MSIIVMFSQISYFNIWIESERRFITNHHTNICLYEDHFHSDKNLCYTQNVVWSYLEYFLISLKEYVNLNLIFDERQILLKL